MTITTCQKVTLISCAVLCISLFLPRMLLPRGKKEKGHPAVGPGFYPSIMHQLSVQEDPDQWDVDLSASLTHTVEAMAKVKSSGRGKKYNLMAQIIPIYGFGILLYIVYIIYKLTCKGKTNKSGNPSTVTNVKVSNMITPDYEFARLQERLLRTEMMMERIVSERGHASSSGKRRKSKSSITKKEEKLLKQLRQITLLMQESRLDGASPEMEAEEVPYSSDWEGYPEETYPEYNIPRDRRGFETIKLGEVPQHPSQLTAEALAERMEQEEEEIAGRKLSIVQEEDEDEGDREKKVDDQDEEEEVEETGESMEEEEEEEEEEAEKKCLLSLSLPVAGRKKERVGLEVSKELQRPNRGKKQITFSDQKLVFHYPREDTFEEEEGKEDEVEEEDEGTEVEEEEDEEEEGGTEEEDDDDPLMEAESLKFGSEGSSNPEEEAEDDKEEFVLMSVPVESGGHIHTDTPKEVGVSGLRMRNRRET